MTAKKVCKCGGEMRMTSCGCYVCRDCEDHQGLDRCFCGWSRSGGDGRRELVEMGETLEEE